MDTEPFLKSSERCFSILRACDKQVYCYVGGPHHVNQGRTADWSESGG